MKVSKKLGITVGIVAVLIGAGIATAHLLNGAATGTVTVQSAKTTQPQKVSYVTQDSPYARFRYPDYFSVVASEPAVDPTLTSFKYTRQKVGTWALAVGIYKLPTGQLRDDGSYNYRKTFPQQYVFTTETINGQPVQIASDVTTGSFSKVAFLQHGTRDATISLIGGDPTDDTALQTVLTDIVQSWQWY